MTAVLAAPPTCRPVVIRPAPRREPPFDDELPDPSSLPRPWDRHLPFEVAPARPRVWRSEPPLPTGLPEPGQWGRRLLVGMIETAGGRRPLHQLASMLSPSVTRGIGADFERAAQNGASHWLHRAAVRRMRVCEPAHGVAELCATVDAGARVRAVAMRVEERHGRWCCTRLQLG